jgi:fatty acid kinase fatty acid binding subunit
LTVGVVTDSACSLPGELVAESGLTVVPMWVNIGGRTYQDGELALSEVLARAGEGLSTSGPAPGDVAAAVARADEGDGVVVLSVSRRMSSTWESARLAAKLVGGEKAVEVVDTRTAAGAQGLVALEASRAAAAGATLSGVVAAAERAAKRVRLLATVPSLDHLARSGRVPGAAAWGAKWLGLNPVFEFKGGRVWPLAPARSARLASRRILAALARDFERDPAGAPVLHVASLHAMDQAVGEELLIGAKAIAGAEPAAAFVSSFSSVMVAHTGPGLVGLAWWLSS